jgi:hypothetical protein
VRLVCAKTNEGICQKIEKNIVKLMDIPAAKPAAKMVKTIGVRIAECGSSADVLSAAGNRNPKRYAE